jgi:hypothetical protein
MLVDIYESLALDAVDKHAVVIVIDDDEWLVLPEDYAWRMEEPNRL